MEKRNVPEIRFEGFTDEWEQRKIGDCFSERVENMPDGELISVTINEGIKKFSELGRYNNSNEDKSKYKKVCVGDIAYNSMRMWQGASGYSPYEGIVSPAYTVLSPKENINSKCMAYLFKKPDMIHTFQVNSQGITSDNWNLKYPTLSEIEIWVPKDINEQKKIATFFSNIDNLIDLHKCKYEKLKLLKEAMLDKMFPKNGEQIPEIRFRGFTRAWEPYKLSEIVDICSGRDYKHLSEGDIPVYGTGGYMLSVNEALSYDRDAIGIGRKGTIDKPYILRAPFWTVDTLFYAVPHNSDNIDFVFAIFQTIDWRKKDESTGVPSLSKEAINETEIMVPSSKERKKIGAYFKQLDNRITLHQQKYEKLKLFKESMLDKMFI